MDELRDRLKIEFPLQASPIEKGNRDDVVHIYYKGEDREFIELLPLCVTYFIVFLYLAFSVAKIEMVKSKWGLAFSAVISVIASLIMASGLCSFFGLVTTLDSSEVFPYLVIVVGVENILVITKSVVSTPVDLEVKIRVAQGLSKEGWYIFKNLCTEIAVLLSGYFTFVPAVQEFCLFAMVCLLSDFFLQMVLFVTVLSIDIRRMELSDLQRLQHVSRQRSGSADSQGTASKLLQTPTSPVPSPPHSPEPVQFFGLLPPLPLSSLTAQSTPSRECPVLPRKLPKRLNIAYFWARTRIVQKACMIGFIIYFMYILSCPSSQSGETSKQWANLETSVSHSTMDNSSFQYGDSKIKLPQEEIEMNTEPKEKATRRKREFLKKPTSVEFWNGLYQRYWPDVLNYYNISLLGRYVTVLPPVHLGVNIDTDIFVKNSFEQNGELFTDGDEFTTVYGTVKLEESQANGQETPAGGKETLDAKYYHNALSCVVLGVVVMIILFFVCKFLNDLQVNPRSGSGRKRTGYGRRALVESVPFSLRGHTQSVEHLKCTVSSIISICLRGQICVWDIATGYRLTVITRKSFLKIESTPKRRHLKHKKSKLKRSVDMDSGCTSKGVIAHSPSPRPLSDSECTTPQFCSVDENTREATNDTLLSPTEEHEVLNRDCSKTTGFDFSKYANGTGIPAWSTRVSSRGSFTSSWSSADGEDPGRLTSSEESADEQVFSQTSNDSKNESTGTSVWCVDCKGDLLVTGCSDGTIEIWSVSSGVLVYVSHESSMGVTKLRFLFNSAQFVLARLDGTLEFYELGFSSRPRLDLPLQESSPIKRSSPRFTRKSNTQSSKTTDATLSGDSTAVAFGNSHAHNLSENPLCRIRQKLWAHHQPISVLDVMDGRIITGSHDRTLKVFRTDECICVYTLHGHADSITALTIDKTNNRQVVSGAANGGVRVWDVINGECLQHLRGHVKSVTSVACTAEHLLSVSLESVLCIWDRSRGECMHRLKQFPDLCSNIAMLSKTLFITGGQGHISVWDVLSGRRVKTVLLGDDDISVFVRHVHVCDNKSVVCDYGKELKIVNFPAVMNKAE
ncbi:sterol regulatory element-binding protein cleavage-activating protein-like isoform X4 [Porites lutea]